MIGCAKKVFVMTEIRNDYSRQRGVTLIEVLIAMLILAVGLLGMASLQVRAVSDTSNSSFRSIAIFYVNDMADRIRANPVGEQGNLYNDASGGSEKDNCLKVAGCNSSDMAAHDKWEWLENVGDALPAGAGTITKTGNVYTVTVSWNSRVQAQDANGDQIGTVTSSVNFSFEP
jgi:type IV pilus assembly protein PilV